MQTQQDVPAARAAVFCLVDEERRSRGLAPLLPNAELDAASQVHSEDMVQRDFFAHTAPDPSPAGAHAHDRAWSMGYDVQLVRENLAGGLPRPLDLVLGWMSSEHHCENLLDPDVIDVGLGIVAAPFAGTPGPAWTLLVGAERSALPPDADGRPSAGCPYAQLGTGRPPGPDPAAAPPQPTPAPAPAPAPQPQPDPRAAALIAGSAGPQLPEADIAGLKVRWVDGLLQVSGRIVPNRTGHKVTIKVLRGKRRARQALRTTRGGRFASVLSIRPDAKGGTVKVTVAGIPGELSSHTARATLPKTRLF